MDWIGYGFAETLSTKLSNVSTINIVERMQLSNAIKELKLQSSGLVDPATTSKLGKMVGARYIVIGSFQKSGEKLKADARIMDVHTSIASNGVDIMGVFNDIFSLETDLSLKLVSALGCKATAMETQIISIPETKSLSAYEWFARGRQMNDDKDYDTALSCFNKAIEINPNYADAYNGRGISHNEKNEFNLAIADYNKAIAINPNYAKAYSNRGNVYDKNKHFDFAIADYSSAIALDPNYSGAYNNRGNVYAHIKDYIRALTNYNKAIELDPNSSQAYSNRGNVYSEKKDFDRAIADFNKAIALNP